MNREGSMLRYEKGFTLIEVLLVMMTLSVMLIGSIFVLQSYTKMMDKKIFIHQLKGDLYYLHSYALNRQESVHFRFTPQYDQYEARSATSNTYILQRKLPPTIKLENSNLSSFSITPQGTVSNFGTITFKQGESKIAVKFFIGRGRFVIEER